MEDIDIVSIYNKLKTISNNIKKNDTKNYEVRKKSGF